MFSGTGAATVCGGKGGQDNVAVSLPAQAILVDTTRKISGRDSAFPLVNAYQPIIDSQAPVSGVSAFPRPAGLSRAYYGLDQPAASVKSNGVKQDVTEDEGSSLGSLGFEYATPGFNPGGGEGGSHGIDWNQVIANLAVGVPNAIAAFRPQSAYTGGNQVTSQPQQPVYQQPPAGYSYNAAGQLVSGAAGTGAGIGAGLGTIANTLTNFVTENPLLVLGGVVGLVLLFRQPPRRR